MMTGTHCIDGVASSGTDFTHFTDLTDVSDGHDDPSGHDGLDQTDGTRGSARTPIITTTLRSTSTSIAAIAPGPSRSHPATRLHCTHRPLRRRGAA